MSLAEELAQVADLHQRGLLDAEEFRQAKQQLLSGQALHPADTVAESPAALGEDPIAVEVGVTNLLPKAPIHVSESRELRVTATDDQLVLQLWDPQHNVQIEEVQLPNFPILAWRLLNGLEQARTLQRLSIGFGDKETIEEALQELYRCGLVKPRHLPSLGAAWIRSDELSVAAQVFSSWVVQEHRARQEAEYRKRETDASYGTQKWPDPAPGLLSAPHSPPGNALPPGAPPQTPLPQGAEWVPVDQIKWRRFGTKDVAAVRCGSCMHEYGVHGAVLEQYRMALSLPGRLNRAGTSMATLGLSRSPQNELAQSAIAVSCPRCGSSAPEIARLAK